MFDRLRNNNTLTPSGAILAWQSYSDEAIEMVRTEVPFLTWLLPVSTAKPPPDGQAPAAALVTSAESPSSSTDGSTLVLGDHYRSPQSVMVDGSRLCR